MISQFLKLLSVIVLAFSAFLFHVWFGGPFHPFTCTLFKLNCPSIDLDGEVLPGFENVQHAFIEHYKKGWDIGSCVVAYGLLWSVLLAVTNKKQTMRMSSNH